MNGVAWEERRGPAVHHQEEPRGPDPDPQKYLTGTLIERP